MGATVCDALRASNDLELVAEFDIGDDRDVITGSGAQVAVDFTTPDAVMGNVEFCVANGINVVVGTTGTMCFHRAGQTWLDAAPSVGGRSGSQLRHRRGSDDGVQAERGALASSQVRSSSCTSASRRGDIACWGTRRSAPPSGSPPPVARPTVVRCPTPRRPASKALAVLTSRACVSAEKSVAVNFSSHIKRCCSAATARR